jgi:endo-1,4-beta-xylanase
MTTALNAYGATGLPVYLSELDITGGGTDAGQLTKYQQLFPVMWTHSAVKGITTWGYIVGQMWHSGTGLVNSNGTERPAMTWLKGFVAGH